eukprot:TRINITY_DN824_c0_g1_i11.p1 TRINITY_DN824_c0_g1~~TRINITY_DN824_c0_g1_i11.p1  ORF type:complete len:889 (+),score=268.74 TRINITY_DN824_c0_g1_i11:851-3517(+)
MQRPSESRYEGYHMWKTLKNPYDSLEYTLYHPLLDRGDECSLLFMAKTSDGAPCAVKCYARYWDETYPDLVETEVRVLKEMKGTEGIVQIIGEGSFMVSGKKYLPMEFVNNRSLFHMARENGPLSEAELRDLLLTLLKVLAKLHSKGIIHRNIKPKHILVQTSSGKNEYRLCDFKYAYDPKSSKCSLNAFLGTPVYMSPEILENEDETYSSAVDVWSLGVTCYHLLNGMTPQNVDCEFPFSLTRKGAKLKFPASLVWPVSKEAQDFISACLTIDVSKRPTAEELMKHPFMLSKNPQPANPLGTILEEEAEQLARLFEKLWAERIKIPLLRRPSLEPYEELKTLGAGQFGKLWQARDKKTGVEYVIKVLRRTKLVNDKAISAMVDEIKLLYTMNKSPYVINIKEVFIHRGDFYLVMEYCNGGDLELYIQNFVIDLPLPLREFKKIAWNVINGLKDLHAQGMVHGELKAHNVLLVKDDSDRLVDAKLCDLGLAQEVELLSGNRTITGSNDFYSPEKWEVLGNSRKSGKVTAKSDVFSYGALLYFIITGTTPFAKGRKYGTVLNFGRKEVPEEIKELVISCLHEKEEDRPTVSSILQHKLFDMIIDIPERTAIAPYIFSDYINKEGKLGVTVMECRRLGSDKELAVKIVNIKGKNSKEYLKQFNKCIDVLMKVSMIPSVVKIHDAFYHKDTLNIIMDYCNSGDLETYIRRHEEQKKEIPTEEKQFIAYCILHGIYSIHNKHQKHTDLSPRNVLLERDLVTAKITRARICDFGINRILAEGPADLKSIPMATCYLAPEMATGNIDYSADVWSFGMMLYFLYFGKHAHDKYSLKDLAEGKEIQEIAKEGKDLVPAHCMPLMLKCMAPNPAERPRTADILKHPVFQPFAGTFLQ